VVVAEVARLAHPHRVQQALLVGAVPCVLVAPVLPVAGGAHVLRVVLPVRVRATGYFHYLLVGLSGLLGDHRWGLFLLRDRLLLRRRELLRGRVLLERFLARGLTVEVLERSTVHVLERVNLGEGHFEFLLYGESLLSLALGEGILRRAPDLLLDFDPVLLEIQVLEQIGRGVMRGDLVVVGELLLLGVYLLVVFGGCFLLGLAGLLDLLHLGVAFNEFLLQKILKELGVQLAGFAHRLACLLVGDDLRQGSQYIELELVGGRRG